MKTTNIRELKHATSTVLEWVEQGETVQITRRNKVVAILSPPPVEKPKKIKRPDFSARLKTMFGDKCFEVSNAELIAGDRGDR
jgi:antitoxin (DNA-binding transcriptional repressor) of toxin-antitoxin stability system